MKETWKDHPYTSRLAEMRALLQHPPARLPDCASRDTLAILGQIVEVDNGLWAPRGWTPTEAPSSPGSHALASPQIAAPRGVDRYRPRAITGGLPRPSTDRAAILHALALWGCWSAETGASIRDLRDGIGSSRISSSVEDLEARGFVARAARGARGSKWFAVRGRVPDNYRSERTIRMRQAPSANSRALVLRALSELGATSKGRAVTAAQIAQQAGLSQGRTSSRLSALTLSGALTREQRSVGIERGRWAQVFFWWITEVKQ